MASLKIPITNLEAVELAKHEHGVSVARPSARVIGRVARCYQDFMSKRGSLISATEAVEKVKDDGILTLLDLIDSNGD
jgi:hypothetical protein